MDELVAIIDQRNQIISSLDQDLQRYTGNKQTNKQRMRSVTYIDVSVGKYLCNFFF